MEHATKALSALPNGALAIARVAEERSLGKNMAGLEAASATAATTTVVLMSKKNTHKSWQEYQADYWNRVSEFYDSLYSNSWSISEDIQTKMLISKVVPKENARVLDLACGTCLGYDLCKLISKNLNYTGLDISPRMARKGMRKYPNIDIHVNDMSDLSVFKSGYFDAVISLNGSFSFTSLPIKTISEVHRVLRNNGRLYLSFLNRWSLRRLIQGRLLRFEQYQTRNNYNGSYIPALTYSASEMKHLLLKFGFDRIEYFGQSVLGGILEHEKFIGLNLVLSLIFPHLCHSLNIVARKQ